MLRLALLPMVSMALAAAPACLDAGEEPPQAFRAQPGVPQDKLATAQLVTAPMPEPEPEALPPPPPPPPPPPIERPFCLVTHYTENMASFAAIAAHSQQRYATAHDYGAKAFVGRISGDKFLDPSRGSPNNLWGGGLFWQKLTAVEDVLLHGIAGPGAQLERCAWVLWLDSDILITNYHIDLEELTSLYTRQYLRSGADEDVDVILSQETDHPISAGAFFVRNSEAGRAFVSAVSALYPLFKDNSLPEQTAMASIAYLAEPWPSDQASLGIHVSLHPRIAVAPQRAFNSFQGVGRSFTPEVQWQPGDFVAHFAGTPRDERAYAMHVLYMATTALPSGNSHYSVPQLWLPPL